MNCIRGFIGFTGDGQADDRGDDKNANKDGLKIIFFYCLGHGIGLSSVVKIIH